MIDDLTNLRAQPAIRPWLSSLSIVYKFVDAVIVVFTLVLSSKLYSEHYVFEYDIPSILSVLLFFVFADLNGLYQPWRGAPLRHQAIRVNIAWVLTVFSLILLGIFTNRYQYYNRDVLHVWFIMTPFTLGLWRTLFQAALGIFRKRGFNRRSVAFAGLTPTAVHLGDRIANAPWMGLEVVGFYDDRGVKRLTGTFEVPFEVQGGFDEMVECAKKGKLDIIYITLPMIGEKRIKHIIHELADTVASVYIVPDFFVYNILHGRWSSLGDMPVVSIYENPFSGAAGVIKRFEDVVLGALILLLIALPMLFIALMILVFNGRPIIFKQRRLGLDGREIKILKFRTMFTVEDDSQILTQCSLQDVRVTRLGRILRSTSLDELPQFLNVLQGKMSIVGPRPHALVHNEEYRRLIHGYMLRHKVRPGITGWAQINGYRGITDTVDKMQGRINCDLWYIRNWSVWLDVKIIFLTLFKGVWLERWSLREKRKN